MSQNTTKTITIKALGGYHKKTPTDNLTAANAIHAGIFTDPTDYPKPPIEESAFKNAIDTLSTRITAARDGGKKAIADRNQQEQIVIKMMRQLGQYAEAACNDDVPTFLKSGFQPAPTVKSPRSPLSQWIRSVKTGKVSGQIHIHLVAVDGAATYEVRWASTVNGTPGTWTSQMVGKTRPAFKITGLTPGTNYTIQVRSFADATGFSEWSDPITRLCA